MLLSMLIKSNSNRHLVSISRIAMAPLGRLPLRAMLIKSQGRGHTPVKPLAMAYFSTRRALWRNQESTSTNKKDPGYWQYDFSFRTQMEKIALIGVLALIASAGPWSWYRDIRHWWTGVPDDEDE